MATAGRNENSDGPIRPAIPYNVFMRTVGETVKGVDSTSAEYDCLKPKWDRIQTVLDGTDAMRAARTTYLPRHEYESNEAYDERIEVAVLDNWTDRTLQTLVGKAFRDPPKIENLPTQLVPFQADADGAGKSMVDIAESWFREAVAKREAWMVVDFTKGLPRADGQPRTKADDDRDGLRPLWRMVPPEDVIFAMGLAKAGRFVWTQVRITENSMEPDGEYGEKLVERIRVLRPGTWELYVKVKDAKRRKWVWKLEDQGSTGMAEIPAHRFRLDGEKPPLEDLVHLNVCHWQSGSDQRSILTVSRFAMLAASGAPQQDPAAGDKPLIVGPKQWLSMPDAQGKFYYVEHTGQAIASGRNDLQDLEGRMSSYGAEFLKKQPGRASATGRALDSSEAQSLLQTWVRQFREALMQVLRYTADWCKVDLGEASVVFDLMADVDAGDPAELQTIDAGRARGDISRDAWAAEMNARNIFRSEYDADADKELIANELPPGTIVGGFMFKEPPAKEPSAPTAKSKKGGPTSPTKD